MKVKQITMPNDCNEWAKKIEHAFQKLQDLIFT
jgi:hypothetical protein